MEHGLTRMHVREANVPDATAIAKVHVESWRTTYTGVVPDEYLAQLSYEQHQQVWRDILPVHVFPRFEGDGFGLRFAERFYEFDLWCYVLRFT